MSTVKRLAMAATDPWRHQSASWGQHLLYGLIIGSLLANIITALVAVFLMVPVCQ